LRPLTSKLLIGVAICADGLSPDGHPAIWVLVSPDVSSDFGMFSPVVTKNSSPLHFYRLLLTSCYLFRNVVFTRYGISFQNRFFCGRAPSSFPISLIRLVVSAWPFSSTSVLSPHFRPYGPMTFRFVFLDVYPTGANTLEKDASSFGFAVLR